MLATSPVVRSTTARCLFLTVAIVTAAVFLWAHYGLPSWRGRLTAIFFILFGELDAKSCLWALGFVLIAALASGVCRVDRLLEWISAHVLWLAGATVPLLSAGTWFIYSNHPLSMDEYTQYLQSEVFAAGKLAGHYPVVLMDWLVPTGFQNYFISVSKTTGAVASGYWPSFALLLAPFTALGIPWACNPLISAATLLAAHRLALKIYQNREAAAWVVLLTAASPEFFANGISYYSMPAHLLANTVFALLLIDPTRSKAFIAGVIGSVALTLHNPFPHLLFALPWILWIAGQRDGNRMTLSLAAGYLPLSLLLGFGWIWFIGHLRNAGIPIADNAADLNGVSAAFSVFAFPDTAVLMARLIGVAKVWVWGVPGLIVLAVAGAWKGWTHPTLRLLAMSAMLTLVGYLIVPVDQGHGWGYRYFHSAWIVLPLLAAGALTRTGVGRPSTTFEDDDSRALVVCFAVLMLGVGCTLRAVQMRGFIARDVAQITGYPGTERRVVLVNANSTFYGADLVQNDPWLRGDVIRMLSRGPEEDARMMARYFVGSRRVYADSHVTVWSRGAIDMDPGVQFRRELDVAK